MVKGWSIPSEPNPLLNKVTQKFVSDANVSRGAEFVVHLLDKTIARYSFQLASGKETIRLVAELNTKVHFAILFKSFKYLAWRRKLTQKRVAILTMFLIHFSLAMNVLSLLLALSCLWL